MMLNDLCVKKKNQYIPLTPAEQELIKPIELLDSRKKIGILLIHGFTSTPAVFRDLVTHFARDYNIIAPVLSGHASTLAAFAHSSGADWFSSVEHAYHKLQNYCEQIYVVGVSLGGVLAVHLAHRYPVAKLMLLAPAFELVKPMWFIYCGANLLSLYKNSIRSVALRCSVSHCFQNPASAARIAAATAAACGCGKCGAQMSRHRAS